MKHSYALVSAKLPRGNALPREESMALLARKYFRSHAPATLEDFVWWSGLNIGDCRKGMDAIASELIQENWKGLRFYRHQDSRTRGFRSGTVTLLPSYDEYLIGYKSRHVAVHPDHSHRAHNQRGIFWPVILQDGEVVGNWSVPAGNPRVEIFHPQADLDEEALQGQITRYNLFLGR
ncbi:MAG: winged helix DNA-binding domain-containing protein [Bacteroidales bacterium]|nr:winged helix DNA-binding domain-containing protein [Bacteroidales bacterium]